VLSAARTQTLLARHRYRSDVKCPSCGTADPDGARFCNACGTHLDPTADGDDRVRDRTGAWDRENSRVLSLLTAHLERGDVFVDVGANEGIFTIPIADHVGIGGRVLAFEPGPDTARRLRSRATAANLLDRVSIYEVALAAGDGQRLLRADGEHPADSTKRSLFIDGPIVAEVPVRAFDGMVAATEIKLDRGLHAVKIDVEGAELQVLEGMERAIRLHQPRVIVVEVIEGHMRRAGYGTPELREFLRHLGYVALDVTNAGLRFDAAFVPT
jgi:FkbM family methyltransferase